MPRRSAYTGLLKGQRRPSKDPARDIFSQELLFYWNLRSMKIICHDTRRRPTELCPTSSAQHNGESAPVDIMFVRTGKNCSRASQLTKRAGVERARGERKIIVHSRESVDKQLKSVLQCAVEQLTLQLSAAAVRSASL